MTKNPTGHTKSDKLTEFRLKELEGNYKEMDIKVDLILSNHLPHLFQAIQSLETRVNVSTAINVGAIVTGILVAKFIL